MDTDRLTDQLIVAYEVYRASHGPRSRETAYARVVGLCDGASAAMGCASIDVQVAVIDAHKSYRMDDKPGEDAARQRMLDDLSARLEKLAS